MYVYKKTCGKWYFLYKEYKPSEPVTNTVEGTKEE